MTTHTTGLNAFALTAREGRTPEPLDILGGTVLVKLTNADSDGADAIFHQTVPPTAGPPLRRHSHEDEWFYVLEGEITVEIDGQRTVAQAGGSVAEDYAVPRALTEDGIRTVVKAFAATARESISGVFLPVWAVRM